MANSSLPTALMRVFEHEGGYADHPRDPGGATNFGITRRTLARWRGQSVSKAEVRSLSRTEAAAIYRACYWDKVGADALPPGLDYCVFDAAVNSGPSRAVRWLQLELGVPADGIAGPVTIGATGHAPAARIVRRYCHRRLGFLKGLETWPTFGRDWARRVREVETTALALARKARVHVAADNGQETESDMQNVKPWYTSKTIWGAVVTLISLTVAAFGYTIGADEQALLGELIPQLIAIVGALVALLGRLSARSVIG